MYRIPLWRISHLCWWMLHIILIWLNNVVLCLYDGLFLWLHNLLERLQIDLTLLLILGRLPIWLYILVMIWWIIIIIVSICLIIFYGFCFFIVIWLPIIPILPWRTMYSIVLFLHIIVRIYICLSRCNVRLIHIHFIRLHIYIRWSLSIRLILRGLLLF